MLPKDESDAARELHVRRNDWSSKATTIAAFACFAAMALLTVLRGFAPTGPARHLDGQIMFIAGHCLARGSSPYDLAVFSALWSEHFGAPRWESMFFPYPVTMFPFVYPLSFFDWETARTVIDTANLVALGAIFWTIVIWARERSADQPRWLVWAALALAASCGAVSGVLTTGQSSLVAMAGVSWAAVLARKRERSLLLGVAVLVASIKPQMTLVPILAILAYSSRRQFVTTVLTMFCGVFALLWITGWQAVPQFIDMLHAYREVASNQGPQLVGAGFLASRMGLSMPVWVAPLVSALTTALFLWIPWKTANPLRAMRQARLSPGLNDFTTSGIALCSSFWMPLHKYDLVISMLPLALIVFQPRWLIVLMLPGLLAIARPDLVASSVGHTVDAPLVASLAMLYCMGAVIGWALVARPGVSRSAQPADSA